MVYGRQQVEAPTLCLAELGEGTKFLVVRGQCIETERPEGKQCGRIQLG